MQSNQVNWVFLLIPRASPRHRNSVFRSNLLQKHQMVFMHIMVVFVNCDLVCAEVCAEEIACVKNKSSVRGTNRNNILKAR